ncbi:MAG: YfhO family protein [Clostridia bacterium]|nr:YfhO family protein [Clostridia bacterium]
MSPLLKRNNRTDEKYLLRKYCFMSAAFSLVIMTIIFIIHDNTLVLGKNTVLRMDLYHQYGPLYAEVYDRITGGNSLMYSWTSGLGASFLGNLFNYCSSPFALIMLIFGHKNMPEAIAMMIMLKAMLASVSFTYYINKSNNCVKKESIVFGLLYAFSAYFVAFSWNIMWFDAIAVFPFVILGIERIIQYNKPVVYIAAMTYTMITNYYMAYMVCILSVMYFLYFYFGRYELSAKIYKPVSDAVFVESDLSEAIASCEESVKNREDAETELVDNNALDDPSDENVFVEQVENTPSVIRKKSRKHRFKYNRFWITGWSFALSSFLCFALSAFALIPIYYCLQTSSATAGTAPEEVKIYFDIFRFIANHLPGIEATIRSSGDNVIPNVYCGLMTVMLLPFYFLSNRISGKQKVVSAVLLIACFAGFALNYFNFIWHGFHMPNDLPYRWSFAYSFFLLIIAFKAFERIDEFSNRAYVGMGFAVMCFVVLVEKIGVPNCTELTLLLSVVFAILYVVIFGMMRSSKYKRKAIVSLLFFAVILEIIVADTPKIVMQQGKEAYTSDYYSYQQLSEEVEENESELFYRTELSKLRARMDPSWYGYNGVSIFSSMAYEHTAKVMEKLGLFGNNINSFTYYPQTPIFNSLFSLKYIYDNKDFINNKDIYTAVGSNEYFDAYEYNYYLPLILSVNDTVKDWDYSSANPFVVQNNLMSSATGVSDILIPVDATSFNKENMNEVSLSTINNATTFSVSKTSNGSDGKAIVKITPEEAGNYYIYVGSTKISALDIKAGELSYNYVSSSIQPFMLDVGYLNADDEIVVTYTVPASNNSATLTFCAAKLDVEKFNAAYSAIKSNGTLNMESFDETEFSGTIKVNNDNALLWTSVPYDESWEISVDGKVLEYTEIDEETEEIIKDGEIVKIGGGLTGIEIEPGEHNIEFRYKAKGLSTGLMLTGIGILIVILLLLYKFLLNDRFKNNKIVPVFLRKPDYTND